MKTVRAFAVAVLVVSCRSGSVEKSERAGAADVSAPNGRSGATPEKARAAGDWKRFGVPLGSAPPASLASVLARPADFADQSMGLSGHVRRACSRRGCWMELAASADPSSPSCRVTFKDYGFFVPTDSAGSSARLEGTLTVRHVAPKLVEHLESEGARFGEKAPDGSAEEVRFVATGVELLRPPA